MSRQAGLRAERKHLAVQLPSGFAELSYIVYEPPRSRRTVLCLHDFLGNATDFSRLATMLVGHGFRVICPDLPGRGESAYLDPADYNPHTYMVSLVSLVQSTGEHRIAAIGKGWGALLALGLLQTQEASITKLILADLGMPWRLTVDDAIAAAAAGPGFTSLEEARRMLAESIEFKGLPPRQALSLIDGRLRQVSAGYGLDFDPAILTSEATTRFSKVSTAGLLAGLKARTLYLSAGPITPRDRAKLREIASQAPQRTFHFAGDLSRAARIHFSSAHEQLLTFGFLMHRFLPE
ncbi:alpha/beta fold hydrolase [Devosia sp. A16]|uniref:alpha/beta fold hydrolase n=1 Tax=Devosia sp. A16 TaxID=1736675 RepID=UPI0006D80B75|nr:alpha/beta hydrolase [Devosia sp. A16]